ncbi:hypothetical protein [Prosthecobacter sp.]|uniref:hypothetical protein n=1 Tax=Prosthecobacter sp. TaxID=1965333 RepID=UPI0037847B3E
MAFASGGLPLLHAREESDLVLQAEAAAQNQELASLAQVVKGLEVQLATLLSQIQDGQKTLAETEATIGSAEARKQAYIAEKKRLEQLLAAFASADTERQTAEKMVESSALPGGASSLSVKDLVTWKTEWKTITSDASTKIKTASTAVQDLQKLQTKWETEQDSLTAAQKADLQGQLVSQQSATESSLKSAREAVAAAEVTLANKIKEQAAKIQQAIKTTAQ